MTPLSRNRDYRLLWGSQLLSEFGFNASAIAFPLLVLAVTGSAAGSGLVLGTVAAAQLAAGLPGGALVDRWSRKKVMLACEAAQALAAGSLVIALSLGVVNLAHMVVVAAVFGVSAALFEPAEDATLPNLVAPEQLSTAVAMNSGRVSLGHLSGTAAGGFLFAIGRFVPFAADAVTHALAFVALSFLRVPVRPPVPGDTVRDDSVPGDTARGDTVRGDTVRDDSVPGDTAPETGHLGREIATGLRWIWGHRHIRVTALCAVVLNLFFSAFYLVVIVLAQRRGVPSAQIGVMAAMLGVGGIVGALAAPYLYRLVSPYVSIAAVFWALAALTPLAVFVHSGYVMGALFFGMALLPPTANTTIMTQQLLLTPDDLRGRMSSGIGLATGVAGALGPVLGGILVAALSASQAVLLCAAGIAVVTVLVTVSPSLRGFPRHQATEESPAPV